MRLGFAVVALGLVLADDCHLAKISGGSTFDQRNVGSQTHPVDVASGGAIVQGVEDDDELLEELDAVVRTGDRVVDCFDVGGRDELEGRLSRDFRL